METYIHEQGGSELLAYQFVYRKRLKIISANLMNPLKWKHYSSLSSKILFLKCEAHFKYRTTTKLTTLLYWPLSCCSSSVSCSHWKWCSPCVSSRCARPYRQLQALDTIEVQSLAEMGNSYQKKIQLTNTSPIISMQSNWH